MSSKAEDNSHPPLLPPKPAASKHPSFAKLHISPPEVEYTNVVPIAIAGLGTPQNDLENMSLHSFASSADLQRSASRSSVTKFFPAELGREGSKVNLIGGTNSTSTSSGPPYYSLRQNSASSARSIRVLASVPASKADKSEKSRSESDKRSAAGDDQRSDSVHRRAASVAVRPADLYKLAPVSTPPRRLCGGAAILVVLLVTLSGVLTSLVVWLLSVFASGVQANAVVSANGTTQCVLSSHERNIRNPGILIALFVAVVCPIMTGALIGTLFLRYVRKPIIQFWR